MLRRLIHTPVAIAGQARAMARIAFIESFPYEAVWGGDAVYIDALRAFLSGRGHEVESYVTDITRGRSNPTVRLRTQATGAHRWHVRNAVKIGEDRFCSLDPRLIRQALRRLPGGRARQQHASHPEEADWVFDRLRAKPVDLVILAFGASEFAARLRPLGASSVALKGFFTDRRIRLGEALPTPFVTPDALKTLALATRVAFSNRSDLDLYARLSGRPNGMLIGMGFKAQIQPAPGGRPTLLFVGARSQPNIESLSWFLDEVWPIIRASVREVELRVVGSVADGFAGRSWPGVRFMGFVSSLADQYCDAAVVVAPLVSGSSGIKTKIAEALSFGRPVVTTSLGVDPGDPDQYGPAVGVADSVSGFAASVIRLLVDGDYRLARCSDAAALFRSQLTDDSAYAGVIDLLGQADAASRPTSL